MGTLCSRSTIRCVSSNRRHHHSSSSSSSNYSTSRNNDNGNNVGSNKRSGHYRRIYLPTLAPFQQLLCPHIVMILLYSISLLQRLWQTHHGPVLMVTVDEEEEPMELGDRALARLGESAGRRNRCLYRLRLVFHAKFLICLGVMLRVRRTSMRALTRIVVIDRGS